MDAVALWLRYGARTGLHEEDPRSQNRDLGHPSDFLRVLKAVVFKEDGRPASRIFSSVKE
jgi:hypothetical protein